MADGERTGGAVLGVGRPEPPENGPSTQPAISADGRHVAFRSPASNLVDDDGNGFADVFVHDRLTGTTERVSVTSDGSEGASVSSAPSIDGSGTRVVFESSSVLVSPGDGNSLTDVYQRDFDTGTTMLVSSFSNGVAGNFVSREPTISADGSTIAFARVGAEGGAVVRGGLEGRRLRRPVDPRRRSRGRRPPTRARARVLR